MQVFILSKLKINLLTLLGNGCKSWRWSNNDNWQYIKELFVQIRMVFYTVPKNPCAHSGRYVGNTKSYLLTNELNLKKKYIL